MNEIPRIIITAHDGTALGDLDPTQLVGLVAIAEVNGENALQVTTTQELKKGDRLLWRDGMGYWHEYVVEGAESPHDTPAGPLHTYYCPWSLQHDLEGTTVTGMPGTGGTPATATQALTAALAGTARWTVGTVALGTTGTASFWRLSGWEALQTLVEVWGGEVQDTITVGANGVTARAVDLLTHVGASTATRRFDYGEDVTGITRTISDELWTPRVMPLGAGEETESGGYGRKITIEDANGGVDYLENPDVLSLTRVPDGNGGWEYPTQVVENPDCTTPADLKAWALANLDTWTTPRVSYEADVVTLQRAGMGPFGVGLGDEVAVVDRTFTAGGLRIQGRALRIEEDLIDPTATVLTISNLRGSLASTLESLARATAEVRDMVTGMSANQSSAQWVSDLLTRINAEANATGGFTYITEGQGIRCYDVAVTDPLVGAEASAVCEVKGGTMRIANSKDSGGNWEWKTVFTSGRILAELIDAIGASSGYHAQLTPTGLDVYDGADVIAHFGAEAVLGSTDAYNALVDSGGFAVRNELDEIVRMTGTALHYYDGARETGYTFSGGLDFGDRGTARASGYTYNTQIGTSWEMTENRVSLTAKATNSWGDGDPATIRVSSTIGAQSGVVYKISSALMEANSISLDAQKIRLLDSSQSWFVGDIDMHYAAKAIASQSGTVTASTVGNVSAGSYKDVAVTFPDGYNETPNVVVGFRTTSTAGAFGLCSVGVVSVDNYGFTARVFNGDSQTRNPGIYWIAQP